MLTLEQKILAAASPLEPDPPQLQVLRELVEELPDQSELITTAVGEGMAGLLYRNLLLAEALELLDSGRSEELQAIYRRTARENLKRTHDLAELLSGLAGRDVSIVLLKGMDLLNTIYGDIGLREMSDIDLWILEGKPGTCRDVLLGLGYAQDPLYPNTFRRGLTTLDVHTHPLGADRIRRRESILAEDSTQIFRNTHITEFEGQPVRTLDTFDQVLFLGLHSLKHNVEKLIWMVDIRGIVSGWEPSDWDRFLTRAGELGQEKTASRIIYLLQYLLLFEPPPGIAGPHEGAGCRGLEGALLRRRIEGKELPAWAPLLFLMPGGGIRRRFGFVVENLFPRPEILRQSFPGYRRARPWRLYLIRAWQLLCWLASATRRSLSRSPRED